MIKALRSRVMTFRRLSTLALKQIVGRAPNMSKLIIRKSELLDGKIIFSGNVLLNYEPKICTFTIRKFRDEKITFDYPIELLGPVPMTLRRYLAYLIGLRWKQFTVTIDFPWADMPSSIYGMGYRIDDKRTSPHILSQACRLLSDDDANRTYCIFVEPSVRVPRIEMYHFGSNTVDALREQANLPRPKKISCVIGEYTNTARDNGQALFEWMRDNVDDIDVSYIVEAKNTDGYPTGKDNVVAFGTAEHLSNCINAQVCAFSHHRSYVYPYIIRMIASRRYNDTRTIFLQHGIIAMKRSIVAHYHRKRVNYDAFCVSSQNEKNIITRHFGYGKVQVYATGLARFDRLYRNAQKAQKPDDHVLFFPTWRQGLEKKTLEEAAQEPFIQQWQNAISMVRDAGIRTTLVLHPMLQRHAALFEPYVDQIRKTRNFQGALIEASALVTDYSSVSFDAIFLEKPAFLFQFDQIDMGVKQEAFIDVDTESPGPICQTTEELMTAILNAREAGWAFDYHAQRDLFFDHCDDQNSSRIVALIRTLAMTN